MHMKVEIIALKKINLGLISATLRQCTEEFENKPYFNNGMTNQLSLLLSAKMYKALIAFIYPKVC